MSAEHRRGVSDASDCALVFIDYQDRVIDGIWEQHRRVVELHARTPGEGHRRNRLVMCRLLTSVCLAYAAADALADGYEVTFVANAVADTTKEQHDIGRRPARLARPTAARCPSRGTTRSPRQR